MACHSKGRSSEGWGMLCTPELSIEADVSVPARLTGKFDWRFWHFASDAPCAQEVRVLGIGGPAVNAKSTRLTDAVEKVSAKELWN